MPRLKKSGFLESLRFIFRAYWRRILRSFSETIPFLLAIKQPYPFSFRKRENVRRWACWKEQPLSWTTVFTVTSRPLSPSLCNPRMRARPSLSLIFLGLPLLRVTFFTCERWLLVLSHIRATDDFEISHFRAISRSVSPVFSLRNQPLACCSAEIFLVYTITYCETVFSSNRWTVNPVYSLKYFTRDYATKRVLSYDEFKMVVFTFRRKVRYKTPDIFQTCSSCDNSLENPKKHIFPVQTQ